MKCGAYDYSLDDTDSLSTINVSAHTIDFLTPTVGTYPLTLTVSIPSRPVITPVTTSFTVTVVIPCSSAALSFPSVTPLQQNFSTMTF